MKPAFHFTFVYLFLLAMSYWSPATSPIQANELGKVMILEYHQIEDKEDRWTRTIANFKHDLERLYEGGYRLIGLNDYIDGHINVPAGKTPVILTFDDSSPGQFRYLGRNGHVEIDPNCAVGTLENFNKAHPDFGHKATFFVLPGAKQPHKLFGQPEYEKKKLQYLAERGFEIGNHTLWHANLRKYESIITKQLALPIKSVQEAVPHYRVRSLALPFGVYPKDIGAAVRGQFDGVSYHHEAILEVSGGAAPSPYHVSCDLLHLPRIQVVSRELDYWLKYFNDHPQERFISDGNPDLVTIPKAKEKLLNHTRFGKLNVVTY